MKKILALLVCLLTISTGVRADDDRPVPVSYTHLTLPTT